jgi:phage protein U
MADVLMTLGDIRFSVAEGAYQSLNRELEVMTAKIARAGRQSARQTLGLDETVDIEGVCYPGQRHARDRVESFRLAAREQKPLMLTDGTGKVWGLFMIEGVSERGSAFLSNGVAQRQDFRIRLGAYGEDAA